MFWSSRRRRSSLSLQRQLRRPALGHVGDHGDEGQRPAVVVGDRPHDHVAPGDAAVLAHVALLAGVLVDLAGGEALDLRDVRGDVVGVRDVGESALEQLVHGVAGHLREPRVDTPKAEVETDEGGADGRLVEGEAEEPLALGERRLRLAQGGHVLHGREGRDHRAVGIPDHRGGDEDGEALTVLAHEGEREGLGPALQRLRKAAWMAAPSSGGQYGCGGPAPTSSSRLKPVISHSAGFTSRCTPSGVSSEKPSSMCSTSSPQQRAPPRSPRAPRGCRSASSSSVASCLGVRVLVCRHAATSRVGPPSSFVRDLIPGLGHEYPKPRGPPSSWLRRHWRTSGGSVKKKVAPSPGSASAQQRPPWRRTRRWTMARPTPSPANSPGGCMRWNTPKRCSA